MPDLTTTKGQREAASALQRAALPYFVGVVVFAVLHLALRPFTPVPDALGGLIAATIFAAIDVHFDATQAPAPSVRQIRVTETVFLLAVAASALSFRGGWSVGYAASAALGVLVTVGAVLMLGKRHQRWQPAGTRLGIFRDALHRHPLPVRILGITVAAVLAAVLAATGQPLTVPLGLLLLLAMARQTWRGAKADALTRVAVESVLAGVMTGGAWTPLLESYKRIPLLRLDLNDDGVPALIEVPLPERLPQKKQDDVTLEIEDRLDEWGMYAVNWTTGTGRLLSITLVEPLPERLRWDGSPAREETIVSIGVGKGTPAHKTAAGSKGVGRGELFAFEWDLRTEPHGIAVGTTGSGKSQTISLVMAQLALAGWALVLNDPKMVEFQQWEGRPGVLAVNTTLDEIVLGVEAAAAEMMRRYADMRAAGVNHIDRLPLHARPKRVLVVIDETVELLKPIPARSDEAKETNELKARAGIAIGSILRLGRAAGVHLIIAAQRADRSIVDGEYQNNLAFKVLQGKAETIEKQMIGLADVEATPGIPGRAVARSLRLPQTEVQVAYIDLETDLDRYLPRGGVVAEVARPEHPDIATPPSLDEPVSFEKPVYEAQPVESWAPVKTGDHQVQQPTFVEPSTPQVAAAPSSVPSKTFADVGGYEDLKDRLRRRATMELRDPKTAAQYGVTSAGFVLHGQPGTGKTFLAECLAGEFGARFRLLSSAGLAGQQSGDFAARLAANVDAAIAEAEAGHPSVIVLDEVDAIAPSRGGAQGVSEWARLAVTELLVQVDRVRKAPGVLIVATTNHIDSLDPALIRDGRLEEHLRVDLPDVAAREQILRVALAGRPVSEDLDYAGMAARTIGYSAAALVSLVNAGAIGAAHDGRLIETADLVSQWENSGGTDRPTVEGAGFDQMVLPETTMKAFRGLVRRLKDRDRNLAGNRPTGMLMYGPAGTGKTRSAMAFAAEAGMSFYPVTPGELRATGSGQSEANIRALFARARQNAPAIIFCDEIEGLAGARGQFNNVHGDEMLRALLAEMDGFASDAAGGAPVFVIGATNRREDIDPAMLRAGRLSESIEIGLPDREGRLALLERAIAALQRPVDATVDLGWLADCTDGLAPADVVGVVNRAEARAYDEEQATVTIGDFTAVLGVEAPATTAGASAVPAAPVDAGEWLASFSA